LLERFSFECCKTQIKANATDAAKKQRNGRKIGGARFFKPVAKQV